MGKTQDSVQKPAVFTNFPTYGQQPMYFGSKQSLQKWCLKACTTPTTEITDKKQYTGQKHGVLKNVSTQVSEVIRSKTKAPKMGFKSVYGASSRSYGQKQYTVQKHCALMNVFTEVSDVIRL